MHKIDTALKCGSYKSAHIADHAATQVNEQALPVGPKIDQHFPNAYAKIYILAFLAGIDLDNIEIIHVREMRFYQRQTVFGSMLVRQYKKPGVMSLPDKFCQLGYAFVKIYKVMVALNRFHKLYHPDHFIPEFYGIAFSHFQAFPVIYPAIVFYLAFCYNDLRLSTGLHQVGGLKQLDKGNMVAGYLKFNHGAPKLNYSPNNEIC